MLAVVLSLRDDKQRQQTHERDQVCTPIALGSQQKGEEQLVRYWSGKKAKSQWRASKLADSPSSDKIAVIDHFGSHQEQTKGYQDTK